jgi:hypothetical protein
MTPIEEAARELARRLRLLRQSGLPGRALSQRELGVALDVVVSLISSWENAKKPVTPPDSRIQQYARFFASPRSYNDGHPRLLGDEELAEEEHVVRLEREAELLALAASARGQVVRTAPTGYTNSLRAAAGAKPWRFAVGEVITIVPAALPAERLALVPSSSRFNPDYIESYQYADLDSVIELQGHLRAVNPDNLVQIKVSRDLLDDDRTGHLVLLGGVDWNDMTRQIHDRLGVPVRQVGRPTDADRGAFEIVDGPVHVPTLDDDDQLTEDVAHFVRARNPFNRERTLTICNALYPLGVYGVIRALTDARFRDRNAQYLARRFGDSEVFSILCRVHMIAGAVTVPDWTWAASRLHEWPEGMGDPRAS